MIKKYNNSTAYSLAVGDLADRISGKKNLGQKWSPEKDKLTRQEIEQIQLVLKKKGYYSGEVDGNLGTGTSLAVAEYQKNKKILADGYISKNILQLLLKD